MNTENTGMKLCQSCGMPLTDPSMYGTNADGSANDEYCKYCYVDGKFTFDGTMQEMIDMCVPMMVQNAGMSEAQARELMEKTLPELKRWKTA